MLPLPDVLQLTFFEALTLGAITSATDPVAALAVLKRSGASSYLSTGTPPPPTQTLR
jgi:NhaP-type Na+/H+ or K+/H+ antiporter